MLLAGLVLVAAGGASAQPAGKEAGPGDAFDKLTSQLELTPDQQSQAEPIFQQHRENLRKISERRTSGELQGLAVMRAFKDAQTSLDRELTPILDAEQKKRLAELRNEARQKFTDRVRERQKSPGAR
jgi:hypothetical protein